MKKIKYIYILAATAILSVFTACNETNFDAISPDQLMGDSLTTTYTIAQLKTEFWTDSDAYSDTTNYRGGLYTAKLMESENDIVISGYVTSTDVEGNVYKYIVIQEPGENGQAIKVSIDASGLSAIYPLGQKVWIRCNGLYLGKYGNLPQIGIKYINTSKYKIKKSTGDTIYRVEPGRIPYPIAVSNIHSYGMPDPTVVIPDTMTISQIQNSDSTIFGKLVCIKNAYFTGYDDGDVLSSSDLIFAPSTDGVGYPQSRDITDGTGTIAISTSEYAKFAGYALPASTYRGNITVIVGWYKNYTDASGDWQLTLRLLSDLGTGFEDYLESVQ